MAMYNCEIFNSVFNIIKSPGGYSVNQFLSDFKAPATNDGFNTRGFISMGFNSNMSAALNPAPGCFRFDSGDVTNGGAGFNLPYSRKEMLYSGTAHIVAKTAPLLGLAGLSDTNPAHIIHRVYANSKNSGKFVDESINPAFLMKNSVVVVCPAGTFPVVPNETFGYNNYCSKVKPTATLNVGQYTTFPILSFKKLDILGSRPYLYEQFNTVLKNTPPSSTIFTTDSANAVSPFALIDFPTYSTSVYGVEKDLFTAPVSWAMAVPKYKFPKGSWKPGNTRNDIINAAKAGAASATFSSIAATLASGNPTAIVSSFNTSVNTYAAALNGLGQFEKDMLVLYSSFPETGFTSPTSTPIKRTYIGKSTDSAVDTKTMMCVDVCPDYACPSGDGTVPTECAPGPDGISATRCIAPGTMC